MQGVPADRDEKEGTLQKVRERHVWTIPEGASPEGSIHVRLALSSEGTCAQQSVGKHATSDRQQAKQRDGVLSGARWGSRGPGGPCGEAAPRVSRDGVCEGVLRWVVSGAATRGSHLGGDGVAAAQSFLRSTSSWGWAGVSASSWAFTASLCRQQRPHLQAGGGLHHPSQCCSPGTRARP